MSILSAILPRQENDAEQLSRKDEFITLCGALLLFAAVRLFSVWLSVGHSVFSWGVQPFVWVCLFLWAAGHCHGIMIHQGEHERKLVRGLVLFGAGAWILLYLLWGMSHGTLYSSFTFPSMLSGLYTLVFVTILQEFFRAYLVSAGAQWRGRNSAAIIVTVVLLFAFLRLDISELLYGMRIPVLYRFGMNSVFPALAESLLLTVFACRGAAMPGVLYCTIVRLFHLTGLQSAIPGAALSGLVDTAVPLVVLIMAELAHDEDETPQHPLLSFVSDIGVVIISLAIVLSVLGVLPYQPIAVASGSMKPTLSVGDAAVIDHTATTFVEGDIIQFQSDNTTVIHRVLEVTEDEDGRLCYITQGDANGSPDPDAVYPDQIAGRMLFKIPYIGWVTLIISNVEIVS